MPNFRAQKALNDIIITNLRIDLNTQKNSYLNQAAQKFPTPKSPKIKNFKLKKTLPSSMSLEIQTNPLGSNLHEFSIRTKIGTTRKT